MRLWEENGKREILIAGPMDVVVLRDDLSEDRRIQLQKIQEARTGYPIRIVDLDGDGAPEFVTGGSSSGVDDIVAYESDGSVKWHAKIPLDAKDARWGVEWVRPVGKPGEPMRVWAGMERGDDVYCLDADGRIIAKQQWPPVNSRTNAIIIDVDVDGDGRTELVYPSGDHLVCRRDTGELVFSERVAKASIDWLGAVPLLETGGRTCLQVGWEEASGSRGASCVSISSSEPFARIEMLTGLHGPFFYAPHMIDVATYPEPIAVAPAVLCHEHPRVRVTSGIHGVFLRLFDARGWPIDGVPEGKGGRGHFFYLGRNMSVPIRLGGAPSDAVVVAHDSRLFLVEFPNDACYPPGSSGVARPRLAPD